VTKTFVAALLLQLVEEARIGLWSSGQVWRDRFRRLQKTTSR
jgi:hypothetical protein